MSKKDRFNRRFRPKTFGEVVGQDDNLKLLQKMQEESELGAVGFSGETGSGKTTLARILALSLQCRHQKEFGYPCRKCYKRRYSYDIIEVNASKFRSVEELEKIVETSDLFPSHGSRYRIFILDELHRASDVAQDMLLKYVEDSPKTTFWIICTTREDKLIKTLRTRPGLWVHVNSLDEAGIRRLVKNILKKLHKEEEFSAVKLSEALYENGVTSARLVANAVQKYVAGASAEEAAKVGNETKFNLKAVTKSMLKGDWSGVRTEMSGASKEDARKVRAAIASYLKEVLINSEELDDNTEAVANAIQQLSLQADDSTILAVTISVLFKMTRIFYKYAH